MTLNDTELVFNVIHLNFVYICVCYSLASNVHFLWQCTDTCVACGNIHTSTLSVTMYTTVNVQIFVGTIFRALNFRGD